MGEKIALRRLAYLQEGFETALMEAAGKLTDLGFTEAERIRMQILKTGGIARNL